MPDGIEAKWALEILTAYHDYLQVLAIERMRARGIRVSKPDFYNETITDWASCRDDWIAGRD